MPVGEIMAALAEHRAAGRIGATSGSNWSTDRLAEANAWATAHGLPPFDAASPNLSLAVPTRPPWPGCLTAGDPASLAWYEQSQLPLFAWAPLARGYFTAAADRCQAPIRRHALIPLDQDIDAAAAFDSAGQPATDATVRGSSPESSGRRPTRWRWPGSSTSRSRPGRSSARGPPPSSKSASPRPTSR